MALTIDGPNKLLILDTATTWNFHDDIYVPVINWSVLSGNMKYLLPCQGYGKVPLGGGVYTDIIFKLLNGWKIKPSGYSSGTQITINGTFVTDDGSAPTVAPTSGGYPVWLFKVATYGVISTGGGSSITVADIWNDTASYPSNSKGGRIIHSDNVIGDEIE